MKTIAELEKYLEEECYSFYAITIGKHMAPEGFVIKQDGQEYIYMAIPKEVFFVRLRLLNQKKNLLIMH